MLRYNLKKILIEEDELDLIDTTSFLDKYDKVPDHDPLRPDADSPEWEEYHDDLHAHVRNRLTDYVKNNPDVLPEPLPSFGTSVIVKSWIEKYMKDLWTSPVLNSKDGTYDGNPDHIRYSQAGPWIEDFHNYLADDNRHTLADRADQYRSYRSSSSGQLFRDFLKGNPEVAGEFKYYEPKEVPRNRP